ncbi:pyridoxamine 5'-phosphate oxidase [Streptomyces sp. NPDC060194]|uniref:pyridoxamine 5'-phosphate oxidase n=1 Tax=Streptomyces sp. NPDC060194 TaxID=3347069 RepID=UPI00364EC627
MASVTTDPDPAAMREQYRTQGLDAADLAPTPLRQFRRWFTEAHASGLLHEPNAMVVSTATPDGVPSSRTVLLKAYDETSLVFFTNYGSRKARELDANPHVALLFPWHALARQVIVTGTACHVSREETAAYFHSRPHGSQLGALASPQSSVIPSRAVLDDRYADLAAAYPEGTEVPVPDDWGGIRVTPTAVEFWQGRTNRLHDRLRYVADDASDGGWRIERLAP